MKNKILLMSLNSAFKNIDKIDKVENKITSYKYILKKATSMLNLVNSRLENMTVKTEKKLKKEKDKIKLNEKINKYFEKNKEFVLEHLKNEYELFVKEFKRLKDNLGE